MKIGLTGQIGAGKSTAAEILRSFGAHVIDADAIGKEVVEKSATLRKQLAESFGRSILDKKGDLRRTHLAKLAFASEDQTRTLNSLVHPHLLKRLNAEIGKGCSCKDVIVIDAALLVAWGLEKHLDLVLLIAAPEKLRLKRMAARGINLEDARKRQAAQPSIEAMRGAANVIIENNQTPVELAGKLVQFWSRYVLPRLSTPSGAKA